MSSAPVSCPGAGLGVYIGGILGRLVAEAWAGVDTRARDTLRHAGVRTGLATVAATLPPSTHQLITYTPYRFEICVRDTTWSASSEPPGSADCCQR